MGTVEISRRGRKMLWVERIPAKFMTAPRENSADRRRRILGVPDGQPPPGPMINPRKRSLRSRLYRTDPAVSKSKSMLNSDGICRYIFAYSVIAIEAPNT